MEGSSNEGIGSDQRLILAADDDGDIILFFLYIRVCHLHVNVATWFNKTRVPSIQKDNYVG
jgi:hypothetical protein